MTRCDMSDVEIVAVLIPCPYCHSGFQWCRTKSGAWSSYLHADRSEPVYRLWREGFLEGMIDGLESARRRITDRMPTDGPHVVAVLNDIDRMVASWRS